MLCRFTLDEVSQLDQDTSTALAIIREWKNSFTHVNRVPLDILSLIPTHLSSHEDRLRATSVCRHWRRTFIQRAELWTELFLSKGDAYLKTFLERAKGSQLDVIAECGVPIGTMALLSPYTKQIRRLEFSLDGRANFKRFLQVNPGPLPLLHTLTINTEGDSEDLDSATPSPSLFSNATNLKFFRFHSTSDLWPFVNSFTFPTLVSFDLSLFAPNEFRASRLLEFLEASPMLRTIRMDITGSIFVHDIPRERIILLSDVETLTLVVSDGRSGRKIATHISCPSARSVTLMHEAHVNDPVMGAMLPDSVSWDAIVRQYTRNVVEEVTLEIKPGFATTTCKITFQYPDATFIDLGFEVTEDARGQAFLPARVRYEVLTEATRTILDHPQLASIKRLHICHSYLVYSSREAAHVANEVGRLFKSLGPLDELTIYYCDLRPYLNPFFDPPGEHIEFPSIKKLTISHPTRSHEEQYATAIVRFAEAQHARGIPFERVVIRMERVFVGMEKRLKPWVGSVELYDD